MTVVVLLPGMDGSGSLFSDFIAALGAKAVVISYPPHQPLGYDELEKLVRASLPTGEPFIIVGESFSGPLAIRLASSGLSNLRAAVLVCTFARSPGPRLPRLLQQFVSACPFWLAPASFSAFVLLGRFKSQALQAKLSMAMREVTSAVWRARLRAVLSVDVTDRLPKIDVPVLYLSASRDRVVSPSASELIVRNSEKVKVVEIDGPHFLLQTNPAEAAAALREFADEAGIAL